MGNCLYMSDIIIIDSVINDSSIVQSNDPRIQKLLLIIGRLRTMVEYQRIKIKKSQEVIDFYKKFIRDLFW